MSCAGSVGAGGCASGRGRPRPGGPHDGSRPTSWWSEAAGPGCRPRIEAAERRRQGRPGRGGTRARGRVADRGRTRCRLGIHRPADRLGDRGRRRALDRRDGRRLVRRDGGGHRRGRPPRDPCGIGGGGDRVVRARAARARRRPPGGDGRPNGDRAHRAVRRPAGQERPARGRRSGTGGRPANGSGVPACQS